MLEFFFHHIHTYIHTYTHIYTQDASILPPSQSYIHTYTYTHTYMHTRRMLHFPLLPKALLAPNAYRYAYGATPRSQGTTLMSRSQRLQLFDQQ